MKSRPPQLTRQTMLILSLLSFSKEPLAGSDLASSSQLASGTLYPILLRLEEAGWVVGEWEETIASSSKPRRRLYAITALGARRAREEAAEWKTLVEAFI